MQAPVYLCLLGNDPAPAYLGLKVVEREAGRVAKAVFYSFPAWNEEYGKKRQAFFRLLSEKGVLYEERPLEKGLEEAEAREVWVNLTGGAKYWAVRFLGHWRRPGGWASRWPPNSAPTSTPTARTTESAGWRDRSWLICVGSITEPAARWCPRARWPLSWPRRDSQTCASWRAGWTRSALTPRSAA